MENILNKIETSNKLLLLKFSAEWCNPCKMLSKIVEGISEKRDDFELIDIDVDEHPTLSGKFLVRNVPTMIFIKNGKELDKIVGTTSANNINTLIDANK